MEIKLGVCGITGRMGQLLVEEIRAAGATLAGGTSRRTDDQGQRSWPVFSDLAAMAAVSDVVIDFTNAAAVQATARALVQAGRPWVLGTSGLSTSDDAAVTEAAQSIPIVYAANFSPGVNLVLKLAERMAAALPGESYDAEIVEMHHRHKVDAPSGTAIAIGRAVARGRGIDLADHMASGRDGHTGPRKSGAIGFAALRGGEVVGEHTLLFAAASEHIAITHRSFDRRVYATGAVQAACWLSGRPAGLYGMSDVLGL